MNKNRWCRNSKGARFAQPARRRTAPAASVGSNAEILEQRTLLSATYQSFDGSNNNLVHPDWGTAGSDLLRTAPADYGDGISTPAGADRPSAREISNDVAAHPDESIPNDRQLSNFIYAWGQFIDHDIDLTTSGSPAERFNIQVPTGDPQFDPNGTGTQIIPLTRSEFDPATGTDSSNPRQQVNDISAYLDGSVVYGSDATRAAALRTFEGGHLKTSDGDLLPFNTDGLPNANDAHLVPDSELFLAGDVRANENSELTALQTLFVREHNLLADKLAQVHPQWNDEQLYQEARKLVIAEIQSITYNEFLPALLGPDAMTPYHGYSSSVNPGIANEFSTAAYRVGHTLLGEDVGFFDNNGNDVQPEIPLSQAFFNPSIIEQTGIDPLLKYLASDRAEEIDTKLVDSVRNFLFGPPGSGGLDLASLNIQRGRDHGLADYNSTREAYGLSRVHSFADITSDVALQHELEQLYGSVDNIDLWVGGLAEDHVPGGSMGPTFTRIIADQFERLRDGDRFWYQREFSGVTLRVLEHNTLADVIRRNTGVTNLQDNVFVFQATITGRVFADANGNGKRNAGDQGVAGRTIELLDSEGNVLQTTKTRRDGTYGFYDLDIGSYTVREVLPPGIKQTAAPTSPLAITRGMTLRNENFGESHRAARPPAGGQHSVALHLGSLGSIFADFGRESDRPHR